MRQFFLQISILFVFFALLLCPELSIAGAKDGLLLWYNCVVPTLFPFMILSNIMLKTNSIEWFHFLFAPLYRFFPNFNKNIPYLFLLGFFCGYPMGAKTMDDLLAKNLIDKKFAAFSLVLFNHASPMFLIGYILTATLKKKLSIPLFFFLLYTPYCLYAFFLFFLTRFFAKNRKKHVALAFASHQKTCRDTLTNTTPSDNITSPSDSSVFLDSFSVLVKVGCYMMLFSILCRFLLFFLPKDNFFVILLIGMTEITTGIPFIANSILPPSEKIALICAVTSFGGLCSLAQTKGVLTKSELSVTFYFILKLFFGVASYFLAKLFL